MAAVTAEEREREQREREEREWRRAQRVMIAWSVFVVLALVVVWWVTGW